MKSKAESNIIRVDGVTYKIKVVDRMTPKDYDIMYITMAHIFGGTIYVDLIL